MSKNNNEEIKRKLDTISKNNLKQYIKQTKQELVGLEKLLDREILKIDSNINLLTYEEKEDLIDDDYILIHKNLNCYNTISNELDIEYNKETKREFKKQYKEKYNETYHENNNKEKYIKTLITVKDKARKALELNIDFTNTDIYKKALQLWKFLRLVHKNTISESYSEHAIELRVVYRNKFYKDIIKCPFINSLNLYNFNEKSFKEFILYYISIYGILADSYHSNFAFIKKNKEVMVNVSNALGLSKLVIDFDDMNEEEFLYYIKILEAIELIPQVIVKTGHGYQAHFLLNEFIKDLSLMKRFTLTLKSKDIRCDFAVIDAARVFRNPYSFNCKEFQLKTSECEIIETSIYKINENIESYSVNDIFEKLNSLQTTVEVDLSEFEELVNFTKVNADEEIIFDMFNEEQYENIDTELFEVDDKYKFEDSFTRKEKDIIVSEQIDLTEVSNVKNIEENKEIKENLLTITEYRRREKLYNINFNNLPDVLKDVLVANIELKKRNILAIVIIHHFKEIEKNSFSRQEIIDILCIWNQFAQEFSDRVEITKFVNRVWNKTFEYTKELSEIYGHKFKPTYSFTDRSKIYIHNEFFERLKSSSAEFMDGRALEIYLKLKVLENKEEKIRGYSTKEILDYCNISKVVFSKNIKEKLIKYSFMYVKKQGKIELYYFDKIKYSSKKLGVTEFDINFIERILIDLDDKKITKSELKIYLLLKQMTTIYERRYNSSFNISQERLSQLLNVSESQLSKILTKLEKNDYLKRDKISKYSIIEKTHAYGLKK